MINVQFDVNLFNELKDILLRLHHGESLELVQKDFDQHFKHVTAVDILLIEQELVSGKYVITVENLMKLSQKRAHLYGDTLNEMDIPKSHHPGHPVQIFKDENKAFQSVLSRINNLIELLEKNQQRFDKGMLKRLMEQMSLLGEFYNHYNRKEKLFFPILERYGHHTPARILWEADHRIQNLYKATKRIMERLPEIEFKYFRRSYDKFESKFKEMIFQEESIFLPIVLSIFNEDDWLAIANESDAFGYAIIEPEEEWVPKRESFVENESENDEIEKSANKNLKFGGGYLTIQEANLILNNLPLEITFVDKNDIFKYFNERTAASEMMLVRTPSSIGRNVANCHPPKSLKKVMRLVRDLKTKRRSSESMWFKLKGQYIHITYKGVFDENGEYLGIL